MTCELVCIPPANAAQVWPAVSSFIRSAMKRGAIGAFADIEDAVLKGKCVLWIAWDGIKAHAAAVTEIQVTEWRRVCAILACGGERMGQWLGLLRTIEDYARSENCAATRVIGRLGWQRALAGYKPTRIVLEKVL